MSKGFLDKNITKATNGRGDYAPDSGLTIAGSSEGSLTLQTNCYQIQVYNKLKHESTSYSGDARISFVSGGTADSDGDHDTAAGRYFLVPSGSARVFDVKEYDTVYYKRDDASDAALDIQERIG
ncbi:MAG: hypothetical protein KDD43_00070 [Bdellovibrionales bacterium]|nr:hypothetical protein [Bdellovibrionales bacterium]